MHKFKVGDRVRCIDNNFISQNLITGTVVDDYYKDNDENNVPIRFDGYIYSPLYNYHGAHNKFVKLIIEPWEIWKKLNA